MSADYKPINRANTVQSLLTEGLGYCCEWFFWTQFEGVSADLIAARLGVSVNTVRRHKLWHRQGSFTCTCNTPCLKQRLEELNAKRNVDSNGNTSSVGEDKSLNVPSTNDGSLPARDEAGAQSYLSDNKKGM